MLNDFLALLTQGLLIIALPIVIVFLFQWVRQTGQELRSKLTAQQQQWIDSAVTLGVRAAEQAGLSKQLQGGAAKKAHALKAAQDYLNQLGVKLDVNLLSNLVEAEVYNQFAASTPPTDSPQARSALLEKAVQSAVLAAEQSGLSASIENLGPQKKRYAIEMAARYLEAHGVRIDAGLLGGLVEAEVLRQKLTPQG